MLLSRVALRFSFLLAAICCAASAATPQRPLGLIYDPQSILPLQISKALDRVLHESEELTRETVLLVVSRSADEKAEPRATELFEAWKRDTVDPVSAVLLYLNVERQEVAVRAGVGMDRFLAEFPTERVTRKIFLSELSHGDTTRAIVLTTLEVLRLLENPVVQKGEEKAPLLEAGFSTGVKNPFIARPPRGTFPLWPLAVLASFFVLGYFLWVALSAEAHYSGEGWSRVRNWIPGFVRRKSDAPPLVTGGGVSGNF